jgi:uncharacterized protein (TIGR02270 family)
MPLTPGSAHAFDDLVEESFDEATFLWGRWEQELVSLTRSLDDIWSWTEDRLHGALDGVRAAGPRLVDVARKAMSSKERSRVSVGAALLASSADPEATSALVAALRKAKGPALAPIVRGLELLGTPPALRAAAAVLGERDTPSSKAALCRLKAFFRVAPGPELAAAFEQGDIGAQADAIRASLYLPRHAAEEWLARGLASTDPAVRYAAALTGMRRGDRTAWHVVTAQGGALDAHSGPYLPLLALSGSADQQEVVYAALSVVALRPEAVWSLGHIGTVRAAEACIAGMSHDAVARACGEAYCWITGADLARDGLARVEPEPEVPAFEDDDLDANLVPSPEELWPLPDVDAVKRHWLTRRLDMHPRARHIRGVAASRETMLAAVEEGPMLRRPDLVLELSARTKGRYDVETRAMTARQRIMMADARAAIADGEA